MTHPRKTGQGKQDRAEGPALSARVGRAVGLTHAGMWWEEIARRFWPLLVVVAVVLAVFAFGLPAVLSRGGLWAVAGVSGLAVLLGLGIGGARWRRPQLEAARDRVDADLAGRPLSALRDRVALGGDDAGSAALWQAHLDRMVEEAAKARAIAPDAGLSRRDPLALRLAGMTALAMVALFAPSGQLGQGMAALGASFRPQPAPVPFVDEKGPSWEGWAEPPAYTRRPTIYLNALPLDEVLLLPQGARLSFRLYGEGAEISQTIGAAVPGTDPMAPAFMAEQAGVIEVAGRRFDIVVTPDALPVVATGKAAERRADGKLAQDFTASDDNGIAAGEAVIALDLAAMDRRFGLEVAPEPRDPVRLDLPLPGTGPRKEIRGRLSADLSRHPWANLPVVLTLNVRDGIDQQGVSAPLRMILPGRRFFDPRAAALIELRRDLLWSRDNAGRSAMVLRAISWQPDGVFDAGLTGALQGAVHALEGGPLTDKARDDMAQMLWEAAVALEDGGLADALERMQQAQERLSEAIRNGASPDEVQRLMDELRAATDAYTDMLAEQGRDPSERFDRSGQQGQQVTGDQIQQMMDEIQRLMNEGRMAEAQALLEQFNQMMQNLRVNESADPNGAGRGRPSQRLAETLREQQRLSDDAMRQMQDQYGQWQQPDPQRGQELADRQRQLREDLGRQRGLLPGRGSEQGDQARRSLDEAGRAMEEAEQALRDGDTAGAMQRQAQAIQDMRDGMRALGDMMANNDAPEGPEGRAQQGNQQSGPEGPSGDPRGQRGLAQPYDRKPDTDPLGRSTTGDGGQVTTGDPLTDGVDPSRRARDLQDEIRRRSGERERPRDERDYLGRLLDRF